MGFFRLVSWLLVALGIALLGADAISWLEQGTPVIRTTAEIMNLAGIGIAHDVGDGPVAAVANFLLNAPLWALVGGIGIILTLIFRPLD
jgi:predicted anti-sigma-YlaC factor YlaD